MPKEPVFVDVQHGFDTFVKKICDKKYLLTDHFLGFNQYYENIFLNLLPQQSTVYTGYILSKKVRGRYPGLKFKYSAYETIQYTHAFDLIDHCAKTFVPESHISNFVCSFNRADTPIRQWILAKLHMLGWLNLKFTSKHFVLSKTIYDPIDGNFEVDEEFRNLLVKISWLNDPTNHVANFSPVDILLKKSFVNLVSETMAYNFEVFWTEKLLYPIASQTLWIASAAPGYHLFVKDVLGFKLYDIFDYSFDALIDPYERHHALLKMLQPFAKLSHTELFAIKQSQDDIIKYNYNWLKTAGFIKRLAIFDQFDHMLPHQDNRLEWNEIFCTPVNSEQYDCWIKLKNEYSSS